MEKMKDKLSKTMKGEVEASLRSKGDGRERKRFDESIEVF